MMSELSRREFLKRSKDAGILGGLVAFFGRRGIPEPEPVKEELVINDAVPYLLHSSDVPRSAFAYASGYNILIGYEAMQDTVETGAVIGPELQGASEE